MYSDEQPLQRCLDCKEGQRVVRFIGVGCITHLAVVETKSQKMEVHVCPDTAFNQPSLWLMYKFELVTHAGVSRPSWLTLGKVSSCTVFF